MISDGVDVWRRGHAGGATSMVKSAVSAGGAEAQRRSSHFTGGNRTTVGFRYTHKSQADSTMASSSAVGLPKDMTKSRNTSSPWARPSVASTCGIGVGSNTRPSGMIRHITSSPRYPHIRAIAMTRISSRERPPERATWWADCPRWARWWTMASRLIAVRIFDWCASVRQSAVQKSVAIHAR